MTDPAPSRLDPLRDAAAVEVERWARLGRLIDSTPELDFGAIAEVLAHRRSYDDLGARESEVVLAVWQRRLSDGVAALDFTEELEAAGGPWYEADPSGQVLECWPGGIRRPYLPPEETDHPTGD